MVEWASLLLLVSERQQNFKKIFLSLFFSSSSLEISKRISFNAKQLFFSELEKIFFFFFLMMLNMQHNEKMLMKEKQKKKCLKCTSGNRHWAVEIATDFTLIKRDRQQLIMIEVYLNVKIILISLSWMIVYNLFFSSSHHHHRIIR